MSGFLAKMNKKMNDARFGRKVDSILFKTGIDVIDLLGASYFKDSNDETGITFGLYRPGLTGVIGKSGSAKSTVVLQTVWNICEKYDDSQLIWYDFENSMNRNRIHTFTGVDIDLVDDESKLVYRHADISIEKIFNLVSELKEAKLEYYDDPKNLVENKEGHIDPKTGKLMKIIPPTFIVIDSIRAMTSEKITLSQEDGGMLNNNMFAAQMAQRIGQFARHCTQSSAAANIIVVYINHIQTSINTGFTPKPKYLNYLNQNETLPGGDQLTYYTTTMVKLIPRGNLLPDKTAGNPFKIKGFNLEMFLIKSRDAAAGQGIGLVFDQNTGFDNDICLYTYLDEKKIIKSAGAYKKMDGYDKSFRAGDFKELLETNEEFRTVFRNHCDAALKARVYVPDKFLEIVDGKEVVIDGNVDKVEE